MNKEHKVYYIPECHNSVHGVTTLGDKQTVCTVFSKELENIELPLCIIVKS